MSAQPTCGGCEHFSRQPAKGHNVMSEHGRDWVIHDCKKNNWRVIAPNKACENFEKRKS